MYVSLGALRQALELVGGLAEIDHPADFGPRVLPGVARLVGCDHLSYNEIGPAPDQARSCGYPADLVTPASLDAFAAHLHEHPLVNYYRATGDGRPVKISDFLSRDRFHRLGLYADFFRHFPVEYQLAVSLPSPGEHVIGIALNRGRGDFTEAERDLLGVLRPALMTALARATRSDRARRALTAATDRELASLTDRELQVLELVARGRTNVGIGRALDVSPRTVAKHLEHIYRKLGVTSRAAAVHLAATSWAGRSSATSWAGRS
jgi:DNA-binding CsgD family transcriptional regulator